MTSMQARITWRHSAANMLVTTTAPSNMITPRSTWILHSQCLTCTWGFWQNGVATSLCRAANWSKPAWLVLEICNPCSKSCAAPRKSGATILVRAARGRNIRSAVGRTLRKSKSKVSNHGGPRGTRRKPAGTFVNNRLRHFIFLTSQSQTISPQYCSAAGRLES